MHQAAAATAPAPPFRRRSADRGASATSSWASIGLILLWIVGSIISGQTRKTDPGHDRKGGAQNDPANGLGDRESSAGNGSENFAGSRRRNHRTAGGGRHGSEKGRSAGEDQTGFLQSPGRATGSGDQRGEGDQSSTESDDGEDGAGSEARRGSCSARK